MDFGSCALGSKAGIQKILLTPGEGPEAASLAISKQKIRKSNKNEQTGGILVKRTAIAGYRFIMITGEHSLGVGGTYRRIL